MHDIPDDLSIPAFLKTTTAGMPCRFSSPSGMGKKIDTRPAGYGPSCWEETNHDSDVRQAVELKAAVQQYEDEKRLAALVQWAIENPELAALDRKAKRDAKRRVAAMGVKPVTRRSR